MPISLGVLLLSQEKMWSYQEKQTWRKRAPYPCNVSTEKMLNKQKAEQQAYSEAEKMKVYDLKDREVSLAMQIFWVIIKTCVYVEMMLLWKARVVTKVQVTSLSPFYLGLSNDLNGPFADLPKL